MNNIRGNLAGAGTIIVSALIHWLLSRAVDGVPADQAFFFGTAGSFGFLLVLLVAIRKFARTVPRFFEIELFGAILIPVAMYSANIAILRAIEMNAFDYTVLGVGACVFLFGLGHALCRATLPILVKIGLAISAAGAIWWVFCFATLVTQCLTGNCI